jgi:SAM-dependent methyltransferase
MDNITFESFGCETYQERLQRERSHFNSLAQKSAATELKMPAENIQRYASPPKDTPYALEYAFRLLGDLRDQRVLCLGCGDGLDLVILASLGANVVAVDISDESIALAAERACANGVAARIEFFNCDAGALSAIPNNSVDKALCAAIFHHIDIAAASRELQRVLKPGGVAVCLEPLEVPALWKPLRNLLPKGPEVSADERPLTMHDVNVINETIGKGSAARQFGLSYRLLTVLGRKSKQLTHISHVLDAWLIRNFSICQSLASPTVWSVTKTHVQIVIDARPTASPASSPACAGEDGEAIVTRRCA